MPFSYSVQTEIAGDVLVDVGNLTIDAALSRIANTTGATNVDTDINPVRGFTLVERALLSIIRNLQVTATPSANNLYSYISNPAASVSAPSADAVTDAGTWVNISDIFASGNTTPTSTLPYLIEVTDPSANGIDIGQFKVTLTHGKQNEDYDFELRLAYMNEDGTSFTDVSTNGIPWVRTGPVFSTVDGKIASTVDLSGYLPANVSYPTTDKYLVLMARLADGSALTGNTVNPILQTKSSVVAYNVI